MSRDTNVVVRLIVRDDTAQLRAAEEFIAGGANHKELTIQDADVVACAVENFLKRPGMGFSDCLAVEIARKAGNLPVDTFDRDLSKVGGVQRLK